MAARCRSPSKASPGAGSGFSETCRLFVTRIPFWSPVPARETCRRVGVCKASSTPSRPPDHYSGVQKQSYFPRRRYANTPTRFPSSPKTKETRSFVFVIGFSDPRGLEAAATAGQGSIVVRIEAEDVLFTLSPSVPLAYNGDVVASKWAVGAIRRGPFRRVFATCGT
jgi:hypothetical protein